VAHVKGDSGKFPDRPFGSVFVHNLARETWAVERLGDEPDTDPDLIRVGQMLQIPDASMALPAYTRGASDSQTHRVGRSEGVFEVARRFGVDPTALARTNGIGVNAPIADGDELVVPGRLSRINALVSYVAGDVGVDARLLRELGLLPINRVTAAKASSTF